MLLSGADFLSVFDKHQLDALAMVFLRLHSNGMVVVSSFWGLWLFPFGYLVIKSGFIPRLFGVLLMIAGTAYLIGCVTALLLPAHSHTVSQLMLPLEAGELPIILWLLIKGAKVQPLEDQALRREPRSQ
jgi:predicted transporter